MDGPYYVDSRAPFISADAAARTIIATNVALLPVANLPVLGSNYFGWIGKAVRIRIFGRMSSVATPGTITLSYLWGNGTDANGTSIGTTGAFAPTASQTNLSWEAIAVIRCRATGATGSLLCTGYFEANPAIVASTLQPILIPASAPAAVTVDLTAANVISPQMLAVTATTNTVQVHDFLFEALN